MSTFGFTCPGKWIYPCHIGSAVYLKWVLQNLYHGYYCVLFYILKHWRNIGTCNWWFSFICNIIHTSFFFKMCSNSHVADKWCSQPVLSRGLHGGDLMIASSILFSGNNFNKMELFAKSLQIEFPSQSSFTRLKRRYLVTSVNDFWAEKQEEMVMELANQDLVLLGKNVFLSLVQITQNTPWNMIYKCNHSTSIYYFSCLFFFHVIL